MLQNADTILLITSVISDCSSSLNSNSEAQLKDDQYKMERHFHTR